MGVVRLMMEFVRALLTVTRPYSTNFLDAVYGFIFGSKPVLPPIRDRIILLPATVLAERIRKKQLTATEIMEAYISRIKEAEPLINACVDQRFEDALKEAKAVDLFLSSTSKSEEDIQKETPLLGVPFSCKETIGVKGMYQTCGLYAAKDRKAEEDGVVTSLYRKAGAIPVVATNVPIFCTWWESANLVFGRTKNPYDNARSAGGSSGGEAAVLAYAGAVIGLGNDLAGSIRIPAAFNGIYGHKPSTGMISNFGAWPPDGEVVDQYVGTGPMCRYAQDLPLLTNILSENRIRFEKQIDFRQLKIYYMEQFPGFLLKAIPDVKNAVRKAVKYFEETYNNKPIQITINELGYGLEIWESKLLEAGIPPFKDAIAGPGQKINLFWESLKKVVGLSEHTVPAIYFAIIERRAMDSDYHKFIEMFDTLKKKLDEVLNDGAILLIPTHPEPAPHYLMTIPKYSNLAYTCIFNALGYPATQIPAGLGDRLPIGIQAISATNLDHLCVSTAVELDKVFGGWTCPSEITV